ncbi:MAG: hypothetical protein HC830_01265 [Bacteroidetes bacterium]|nr:hypothetical protein [Bacteroidota bacterium]
MEGKDNVLESLIDSAEELGKTSFELLKYKALDKATFAASAIVLNISVAIIAFLFIVMLSIGLALLIGEALNSAYWGFFIVAGFYALSAVSFYYFFGPAIKKLITSLILKQIFK